MTESGTDLHTKLLADVRKWRETMPPPDGEWAEVADEMKRRLGTIEVLLKEGRIVRALCALTELAAYARQTRVCHFSREKQ